MCEPFLWDLNDPPSEPPSKKRKLNSVRSSAPSTSTPASRTPSSSRKSTGKANSVVAPTTPSTPASNEPKLKCTVCGFVTFASQMNQHKLDAHTDKPDVGGKRERKKSGTKTAAPELAWRDLAG